MANYINRYATLAAYTAEASARDNLGRTVSLVTADGKMHYDGKLNPLGLPAKTIRCKFASGYTPAMGTSQTQVDSANNVWDIGFSSAEKLFQNNTSLLQVLCANTSSVTSMKWMFQGCTSLVSVSLFDTSSVTNMFAMFNNCTNLSSVLLFDTSSVTDMSHMFNGCTSVTGGALALYQQASTQATPPSSHGQTFYQCGKNTTTGAAELAQIPVNWKNFSAG